jgi:hypothetical protein
MLFVHDQDGEYRPAPKELVLTEANKLSGYQLRRGTKILSAETAKTVIGYKLRGKQHEVLPVYSWIANTGSWRLRRCLLVQSIIQQSILGKSSKRLCS